MYQVKRNISSILLLFSSIFIVSCGGNKLSRDMAEQLIKTNGHYPRDKHGEIRITVTVDDSRLPFFLDSFNRLKNAGLIEYQIGPSYFGSAHKTITGTFTDEGSKYVVGIVDKSKGTEVIRVKTGFVEFGEVTGIVERTALNIAEVTYTEKTVVTPFGKFFKANEETVSRVATFTKYDDGWRIE